MDQHYPSIVVPAKLDARNTRVLAIDDSDTCRAYLRQHLAKELYELETAASGKEGLARLTQEDFDCVIVDWLMPEMNGIELCARVNELRSRGELRTMILMLTSKEDPEDMARALEAGADDFVSKSTNIVVLKVRIRTLLRRKAYEEQSGRILAQLRQQEIEVEQSRLEKEAAQAASRVKSEFLANMSHELRTPMNSIIGFTEIMMSDAKDPPNEKRARRLEKVHRNARNLLALINDILDVSKIEADRLTLDREQVDVAALITECVESIRPLVAEDRVELRLQLAPSLGDCVWVGDAVRLRQIVTNLLSNASKFTKPKISEDELGCEL